MGICFGGTKTKKLQMNVQLKSCGENEKSGSAIEEDGESQPAASAKPSVNRG